jgi:hypothetical protein
MGAFALLLLWPVASHAQPFDLDQKFIPEASPPDEFMPGELPVDESYDPLAPGRLFNPDNIDVDTKTVDVGGVSVRVVTPTSLCGLNESDPIDAAILAQMRAMNPNNVALAAYLDCVELADIKAGARQYMTRYISVGTTQAALYQNLTGQEAAVAATACGNTSAERALGESVDTMRQRMQTLADTGFLGMESLGPVRQTADTCYVGYIVRTNIDGVTVTQVSVIAFFTLKGKLIVVNDFISYSPGALDTLLAEQEAYVARLRESNIY